jgi:uncharacterized membrane protein
MLDYVMAYLSAGVVFVTADLTWLTLAGPRVYRPVLGPLLSDRVNGPAALAFYAVYLAGIVILAAAPALKTGCWRTAALNGLALGVVAYATYDLTNQATLKLWSTRLTLIDMAWGGGLTSLAATIAFLVGRRFG